MNKTWWLVIAALCGALVSLRTERQAQTLMQKFLFVLCGFAFSFFVTPLITSHWNVIDPSVIAGIGFLMAIAWQSAYARFVRGVEESRLPFQEEGANNAEILEHLDRLRQERENNNQGEGQ